MTTIAITTVDISPGVEATDLTPGPTTIVTQDIGDGTWPPVVSVVTLTGSESTVIVVNDEPPLTVDINEAGVPGPPGIQGIQGIQGITGIGVSEGMTFTQDMPSTEWLIPHGWDYEPSVTVVDTGGNVIKVGIFYAPGVVTIRTVLPTAGRAYLI